MIVIFGFLYFVVVYYMIFWIEKILDCGYVFIVVISYILDCVVVVWKLIDIFGFCVVDKLNVVDCLVLYVYVFEVNFF